MLSKVITIAQQKGGTGKTTLAVHLAMAFIKYHDLKVAIIDTDPQGSLGKWFMIRSENKVSNEISKQITQLPRKEIAIKAIENSISILVQNSEEALDLINKYAPEHFIVCTKNDNFFVDGIINAGSVFIGNYTPESAGDYASGTNHTLPTNGYSKAYSGVNLDSFTKSITFQEISKIGIQNIGPSIELMAEAEGLQAHKNAVTLRLKELKSC